MIEEVESFDIEEQVGIHSSSETPTAQPRPYCGKEVKVGMAVDRGLEEDVKEGDEGRET